ncbi:elongation of very long chain fatty acids protein 6-like [Mya arenaria]|uniref:elongation of very long chain fatty acids protein 6-like n=1 Tax=Mya arenaria TaxID=6604 RepID=UPI0022E7AF21|nr:elongation of very long chain fatty acids protein 6-like [Mya arenaria]
METKAEIDKFNMSYVFKFEKTFDEGAFNTYMKEHWADSVIYATVYIIVVFGTQFYMHSRKKLELRPFLAFWSGLLAIFSILGSIRTMPELIIGLKVHGFEYSLCNNSFVLQGSITSVWTCMFTLSKVLELGDTVFIVLRKQPLIFLHWYHHVTVLMYTWFTYSQHVAAGRWFMVMNFVVHSFMYSYYCFRAMKYSFPKWVNMFITSLQLLQMLVGICVNVVSYQILNEGRECDQNYDNIKYALMMYFSYFILFAHFFYTSYVVKKPAGHHHHTTTDKQKKH